MVLEKQMIVGMSIAFGLALWGCSRSPAPPIPGETRSQLAIDTLTSENDAIRRFQTVRGALGLAPEPQERLIGRRDMLRNCFAQVNDSLMPQEKKDCIVFGKLTALDREGECWVVEVDQGLLGGQVAYFDDMGNLMFAWRAPEG